MVEYRYQTIAEMFLDVTEKFSDRSAYCYKEKKTWIDMTFGEVRTNVEILSGGMRAIGMEKGDHFAIISENSRWWAMADYASACSGNVLTTVYPTLTPKQIYWIVVHSESKIVYCGSRKLAEKVLKVIEEMPKVTHVVVLDNSLIEHPKFITLDEMLNKGRKYNESHPGEFLESAKSVKPDDLLTLIYTSGTTGEPKGVMLTHFALCSNIDASVQYLSIDENDVFLSFLPLSHSFERMAGHLLPFSEGAKVAYAESVLKVSENMLDVKPTLMVSVPRLYEKIYSKVIDTVSKSSAVKRTIFYWAINTGKKRIKRQEAGRRVGWMLKKRLSIADKLVFKNLRDKIGGRLRYFVSGGAPLSREINLFFNAAGILILEGYGLTETAPVISVNPEFKNKIGTIGIPIANVEVKLEDDGEILMRGPNRMLGYFKDEVTTRETIDEEGWLHTGDVGIMDKEGYITITDRKKNIIVTVGGKNVAPAPMENVLVASKWIEQIVIIGDRQKYLSALVVPAFSNLEEWAKEQEIEFADRIELIKKPAVKEIYNRTIFESMEGFAQFEKVKKYVLLPHEFTIESGELTPSLKVKRNVVMERYKKLIDDLYNNREIVY